MNLNSEETHMLIRTLRHFVLKKRTGEIGIIHGQDRFVSTQMCLKKNEIKNLNSAFKKLGIGDEIPSF